MSYTVAIRNNTTNETRHYQMDQVWGYGHAFWWTDGNFNCDCNRKLHFEHAAGDDSDVFDCDDGTCECSTGKYSVLYAELPCGKIIILEEPKENTLTD